MADITAQLNAILNATYGDEVRSAIYEALVAMNNQVTKAASDAANANALNQTYASTVGTSSDTANRTGTTLWSRVKWLTDSIGTRTGVGTVYAQLRTINDSIGGWSPTYTDRAGDNINSQIEYLQTAVGDMYGISVQSPVGNGVSYTNKDVWSRIRWIGQQFSDTANMSKDGNLSERVNWCVYYLGDPDTMIENNGGAAFSRIAWLLKNVGTRLEAPAEDSNGLWSRCRYAVQRANEAYTLAGGT